MVQGVGNTFLEVDLKKIKNNLIKIKEHIGKSCDIMPVLKANAAGMGLKRLGLFFTEECGIKTVAVAQVYEAMQLREAGIKSDILVMGGVPYNNITAAIEKGIHMPVYNAEFATLVNEEAKKQGKKAMLHIKIETGMNRIGVKPGRRFENLLDTLEKLENIEIMGMYTHLVESDAVDKAFSYGQLELFKSALDQARQRGMVFKYIHICNSSATVWFKEAYFTHVRPGRLLYGIDPNADIKNRLGLEFPVTWYAFVTNVKDLRSGETLGYSRFFRADQPIKVASLSFGYGDGYNRNLIFRGGYVLIKGKRARLLDMCMDQTYVDVTGVDVKPNDRAILLGNDGKENIDLADFTKMLGSTYMNAMSTIAGRVVRVYTE